MQAMKQQQILINEVPSIIQSILFENEKLKEENKEYRSKVINYDKFYTVPLTTKAVAELHDVHEATVRKYVKLKLIPTHPKSTDAKILIRASTAMQLDFELLKKQSHSL